MATTLAARRTKGSRAPVTSFELLFDLVYVFAITQVSHTLLASLTPEGALQSLVLWLAVWLGWQYTCWFTNWFNPDNPKVRLTLAVTMLAALVMAVALPKAFADQGLVFAVAYAGMQVSRAAVAVWLMQPDDPLRDNYRRILGWSGIAAVLWIAGAFAVGPLRLVLWILAIACEQGAPAFGFWLPGLGRSRTSDWTIDGGHLAERCQLVVIVALGEAIMMTGAPLAADGLGHVPEFIAFTVAFVGSITLWWVYFDTGSPRVSHVRGRSGADRVPLPLPARPARGRHHRGRRGQRSDHRPPRPTGPGARRRRAHRRGGGLRARQRAPEAHRLRPLPAVARRRPALFSVLWPLAFLTDHLMVLGLANAALILVAVWERRSRRHDHGHGAA